MVVPGKQFFVNQMLHGCNNFWFNKFMDKVSELISSPIEAKYIIIVMKFTSFITNFQRFQNLIN